MPGPNRGREHAVSKYFLFCQGTLDQADLVLSRTFRSDFVDLVLIYQQLRFANGLRKSVGGSIKSAYAKLCLYCCLHCKKQQQHRNNWQKWSEVIQSAY